MSFNINIQSISPCLFLRCRRHHTDIPPTVDRYTIDPASTDISTDIVSVNTWPTLPLVHMIHYLYRSQPCYLHQGLSLTRGFKKGCHSHFYTHRTLVCTHWVLIGRDFTQYFCPSFWELQWISNTHTEWMSPPCPGGGLKCLVLWVS